MGYIHSGFGREISKKNLKNLVRKTIADAGGSGGGTVDTGNAQYNAVLASLSGISNTIIMSDANAESYLPNDEITVKPIKLVYEDRLDWVNSALYCIYEYHFPIIRGDGMTWVSAVMSQLPYNPPTIIGNNQPYLRGKIDTIPTSGFLNNWKMEETAGEIKYYNYEESTFEEKERMIFFPEHILPGVMFGVISDNTWRYEFDGINRSIYNAINLIPSGIRPFNLSFYIDGLRRINTFKPGYAGDKSVTIYNIQRVPLPFGF